MKKILTLLAALASLCAFQSASANTTATVHSTAAESGHVISTFRGTLLSVSGYNAKSSAQFIQIHDSATVPADLTAEVSTCDLGTRTPAQLANKYFTISSPTVMTVAVTAQGANTAIPVFVITAAA